MSFSRSVKQEILKKLRRKSCCARAFLCAVLKGGGSLLLSQGKVGFVVETDSAPLAETSCRFAEEFFHEQSEVLEVQGGTGKKYSCRWDATLGEKLQIEDVELSTERECCQKAFMQGLFAVCGSVSIPQTQDALFGQSAHSNYHLELRFSDGDFASFVQQKYDFLQFKSVQRKNGVVLYLKEGEKISDFLTYIEAVKGKFTVDNVIIGRSFRNKANRQRNCIDSNIEKSVLAGAKQLADVEKIRRAGRFNSLPEGLRQAAEAREQHPDANLAELAALLGISKSGVNHRLAKIAEIAAQIN